jgi:4-amino-4-deoxy-L-arabinose transferase-like glycosyltransferase
MPGAPRTVLEHHPPNGLVTRWPQTVALLGLLAYLFVSLDRLAVFPAVGQDEPWIAAAPYKLATQGILGSDLFAGYYGMERHHYEQMPVFPLVQGAIFKLFGAGVAQMRALPVACGFLLLLAVFAIGRQAGDDRVGTLALVLMLILRVAAGEDGTGILLLDRARINRYDIAVPVFGLLALWAFNRAERDRRHTWYVLTGLLTGLSSLSHLYGLFWLPVVVGILIARHGSAVLRQRDLWLLLAGFACPWLPWTVYVATGWSDYLGQMRLDADRFDLLNPTFYVDNVLHGEGPISLEWSVRTVRALSFVRFGTWTMLLAGPAALGTMVWEARRHARPAAFSLAVASLAQTVMFVALLKVKTFSYMIALWPLGALLLAWFGVWLWDRRLLVVRLALLMLLGLIVAEGTTRIAHAWRSARQTTPYGSYEAEVASCIPTGSFVLGLQHYWLGLRQYPYRTWLLPIDLASPLYYHDPISLDQALERVDPTVILVDRYIDDLMMTAMNVQDPNHRLYIGFEAFKARRHAKLSCVIKDRTYGTMQIYRVPPR